MRTPGTVCKNLGAVTLLLVDHGTDANYQHKDAGATVLQVAVHVLGVLGHDCCYLRIVHNNNRVDCSMHAFLHGFSPRPSPGFQTQTARYKRTSITIADHMSPNHRGDYSTCADPDPSRRSQCTMCTRFCGAIIVYIKVVWPLTATSPLSQP